MIVNRIFWTAGYNVPSDHGFTVRRAELRIAPGADIATLRVVLNALREQQ